MQRRGCRIARQQKQVLRRRWVHFIIFWWAHTHTHALVEAVARIVRRRRRVGGRCCEQRARLFYSRRRQTPRPREVRSLSPAKTPGESPSARYNFGQLPPSGHIYNINTHFCARGDATRRRSAACSRHESRFSSYYNNARSFVKRSRAKTPPPSRARGVHITCCCELFFSAPRSRTCLLEISFQESIAHGVRGFAVLLKCTPIWCKQRAQWWLTRNTCLFDTRATTAIQRLSELTADKLSYLNAGNLLFCQGNKAVKTL